jgi:signal transduction histidine kinase
VTFTPYPTPLFDDAGAVVGAVNVLVDTTDRFRAEEALRAAAEALQASNAVKDEFLGLVSHELRTPVTTIFGNAQLLGDKGEQLSPADRESMLGDIAAESERLLGVIENLLLLTRLESGIAPDPEPQVIAHVVERAVESFRHRHPGRAVEVQTESRDLIVEGDRSSLELLIENLLSNADKYSPAEAGISVDVRAVDGQAVIEVLDRGIGLGPGDADRLFTPFFRTDAAKAVSGGLGIGLAACRRVTESLGGRIWATSRDGGGSTFGFALPLALPEPGLPLA